MQIPRKTFPPWSWAHSKYAAIIKQGNQCTLMSTSQGSLSQSSCAVLHRHGEPCAATKYSQGPLRCKSADWVPCVSPITGDGGFLGLHWHCWGPVHLWFWRIPPAFFAGSKQNAPWNIPVPTTGQTDPKSRSSSVQASPQQCSAGWVISPSAYFSARGHENYEMIWDIVKEETSLLREKGCSHQQTRDFLCCVTLRAPLHLEFSFSACENVSPTVDWSFLHSAHLCRVERRPCPVTVTLQPEPCQSRRVTVRATFKFT